MMNISLLSNTQLKEIEAILSQDDPKRVVCFRCKVSLGKYFKSFKFCPICHAPRMNSETKKEINKLNGNN